MKIWISYTHHDIAFFEKLRTSLIEHGHTVVHPDIITDVGVSILSKMETEIMTADAFIMIFSKDSSKSKWFSSEYFLILHEASVRKKRKPIIPVVLNKNVELPTIINQYAYADFSNPSEYNNSLQKLLHSLGRQNDEEIINTEKTLDELIKEQEKLLELEKKKYYLETTQRKQVKYLTRISFFITLLAAVVTILIFILGKLKDGNLIESRPSFESIIFYFLGVLTSIVPTIYLLLKRKQKNNGQ
jgi:hypothetical protein